MNLIYNRFSLDDTFSYLRYGLTIGGKTVQDHLETTNHMTAIECLREHLKSDREVSPLMLKSMNSLLLHRLEYKEATGQYKTKPNYVLTKNRVHRYVDPLFVPEQVERMCIWVNSEGYGLHPIVHAAIAKYNMVRIHPFVDGNGRGSRLLMNLVLMKRGWPPAVIRADRKQLYYKGLEKADTAGDLTNLALFIAEEMEYTLKVIADIYDKAERQFIA